MLSKYPWSHAALDWTQPKLRRLCYYLFYVTPSLHRWKRPESFWCRTACKKFWPTPRSLRPFRAGIPGNLPAVAIDLHCNSWRFPIIHVQNGRKLAKQCICSFLSVIVTPYKNTTSTPHARANTQRFTATAGKRGQWKYFITRTMIRASYRVSLISALWHSRRKWVDDFYSAWYVQNVRHRLLMETTIQGSL